MLTIGACSLISSAVYSSASRSLSKEITDKIMEHGLYHVTSDRNADKILEQGKMRPSGYIGSYSTPGRKSCFFFSGIPTASDLMWNIKEINPELTVVKITPETLKENPDFVKKLTYRKIDGAIMYKGTCKAPMEKSKLLFTLKDGKPEVIEDRNGFGERTEEHSKSQRYLKEFSQKNFLSRMTTYFKLKAGELDFSSIKRNLLRFNMFSKKNNHTQYKIEDVVSELENNGQMAFLKDELSNDNFKREHFHSSPIHGVAHSERVCFHAAALGYYEKLPQNELRILIDAAKYHDVGRVGRVIGDIFDFNHGKLSSDKIEKENLVQYESKDDLDILKYIVRNHSVDDKKAFTNIEKSGIQDTEKAHRLLRILKDADNLDRVRTLDLNPKYLRSESAKKMIDVASELFVRHNDIIHSKDKTVAGPRRSENSLNPEHNIDNSRDSKLSDLLSLAEKAGKKIHIPLEKTDQVKSVLRENMKRNHTQNTAQRPAIENFHGSIGDKLPSGGHNR